MCVTKGINNCISHPRQLKTLYTFSPEEDQNYQVIHGVKTSDFDNEWAFVVETVKGKYFLDWAYTFGTWEINANCSGFAEIVRYVCI